MNCRETDRLLFAFVDEELKAQDMKEVSAHLQNCADCRLRYSILTAAKKSLADKHRKTSAPSFLADRIKNAVREVSASETENREPFYRRTLFALAASLVLMSAVILFDITPCRYGHLHAKNPFTGKVVCIGCEYHKKHPDTASPCDTHGHHAAIMTADGRIWHIFPGPEVQNILNYDNSKDKTVAFSGEFFGEAQLLKIDEFSFM